MVHEADKLKKNHVLFVSTLDYLARCYCLVKNDHRCIRVIFAKWEVQPLSFLQVLYFKKIATLRPDIGIE